MTEETPNVPPLEERIDFRNRWIAGLLAWLIPGAGHLYQRRYFKGVVYLVCILGIFVWGSAMGEAKAVHLRWDNGGDAKTRYRALGYLAQVGVGLPTLPAVLQKSRLESQDEFFQQERLAGEVIEEFESEFTGFLRDAASGDAEVTGTISGVLQAGDFSSEFVGTFRGHTSTGNPVEVELAGFAFEIGPRICALDDVTISKIGEDKPQRTFSASRRRIYLESGGGGFIEGTIPRAFVNHYQVPLDDAARQDIYGRLGKYYELALVYTWIAGLLNILAVWDCVQGPAYGYGDEPEPEAPPEAGDESDKTKPAKATATAAVSEPAPDPAKG